VDARWYQGGTFLSSTALTVAVAANTWTYVQGTVTAPASTDGVTAKLTMVSTPPASNIAWIDEVKLSRYDSSVPGGMTLDIPTVLGDVDTPLFAVVAGTMAPNNAIARPISSLSTRSRGNPTAAPFVIQAETATQQTADISTQPNDVKMSGAGNNFSRCTFTSISSLATRLAWNNWPGVASTDMRGTYRAYVRIRPNATTDTFNFQLTFQTVTGGVSTDVVTSPTNPAANPFYLDLGDVQIPPAFDPVTDGFSGVEIAPDLMTVLLAVGRNAGTGGSLDIDLVLLVPADERMLLVQWPHFSDATDWIIDGAHEGVYARGVSGNVRAQSDPVTLAGGFPYLSPGSANRVWFVRDVSYGPGSTQANNVGTDDVTATTSITPYYWPRYLYVRPAAT
jgi:hypothetical protein